MKYYEIILVTLWNICNMGGVHKWRYPNGWMVYGKSQSKLDDDEGTRILGKPPFVLISNGSNLNN